MPVLFTDGFESGDTTKWDGTVITSGETLAVSSVNPLAGSYSLHSRSADAGPDDYATVQKILAGMATVYAKTSSRINEGLPLPREGDRINLLMFMNCANIAIGKASGVDQFQLRVYNPGGTPDWVVINTGIQPQMNTKYSVQLGWKAGNVAEFYLNGQLVASQPLAGLGSENTTVKDIRSGLGITVEAGHILDLSSDECVIAEEYIEPPMARVILTISTTEGGTTNPLPGSHQYEVDSLVTVTASASSGYAFDHWELDGESSILNPLEITMDKDYTLKAVFRASTPFDEFWDAFVEFLENVGAPIPPKPPIPPFPTLPSPS